jgi:hypothetical protein
MMKKIALGALLLGLTAILVAGGVIRTLDMTGNEAEARGGGRGRSASEGVELLAGESGHEAGQEAGGCCSTVEADSPAGQASSGGTAGDWQVYEGTVTQAPALGIDLIIETDDGEEIVAGTGPGYLAEQGFDLAVGERVQVQGFWEDGELKAAQITRLRDGLAIALRDQLGRPAWAGYGQSARAREVVPSLEDRGVGLGQGNRSGDAAGVGQAQLADWFSVEGIVTSAGTLALAVTATDGREIVVDGRAWRYLGEQGFQVAAGDQVRLVGFYEDGRFEAGEVTNLDSGQEVTIRDERGRPLWAAGGRGGS